MADLAAPLRVWTGSQYVTVRPEAQAAGLALTPYVLDDDDAAAWMIVHVGSGRCLSGAYTRAQADELFTWLHLLGVDWTQPWAGLCQPAIRERVNQLRRQHEEAMRLPDPRVPPARPRRRGCG
jgi:hypothetical protein